MQVSIWMVRALIRSVESAGGNRDQFLRAAKLDPAVVDQSEARLDLAHYVRVLEAALTMGGDPALGFRLGEQASAETFHVLAHLVDQAHTLGAVLQCVQRYSTLFAAGFEPRLVEQGELAVLRLPHLVGDLDAVRVTAELVMTGFMRLLRIYVGEGAHARSIHFAYPEPTHVEQYRRVLGPAVYFEQARTELVFPAAWLERCRRYTSPELYAALQSHAERELDSLALEGSMVGRIERLLIQHKPRALPGINDVARQFNMSARTLARKLLSERTTYAEVLERRRGSAAKCMFENRRLTIQEVADAMGFATTPAFHRAFKRWTGLTPKQYIDSISRRRPACIAQLT